MDFQKTHSTKHDIIQLVDQINSCFEKNLALDSDDQDI